jgi:hypothetical protein
MISETKVVGASTKITLPENSNAVPACVKLFEGKYLRDAAQWPQ